MLAPERRDDEVVRWLGQNFQPVPSGLVFRLTTDVGFHDFPEVKLETRGLADGTLRFEPDDIVRMKVLPAYIGMLINRGRYLAHYNQMERAIAVFREAF